MSNRFSAKAEASLRGAGWYPGRAVASEVLEQWYAFKWTTEPGHAQVSPAALRVLREFGGLTVEQDASGITCYRSTFVINPLAALEYDEDGWPCWEWLLEDSLFPIGSIGRDGILAITTHGRVYMLGEHIFLLGDTFEQALECLVFGIMPLRIVFADYNTKAEECEKVQAAIRRLYSGE